MTGQQTLNEYLAEARINKKQRASTDHYQIIRNDKDYLAFIVDSWYDKEKGEIGVGFIVFTSPIGVRREIKFRTNSVGVHFYDELCDTVGTSGNPCELIGKAVHLHFEKNGEFQNVRVDALISKEDLQEALAEMESDEEEIPRKKSKGSKTSKVRKQKAHKERTVKRDEDDFDESEESEVDLDEDTDSEYDSEYDDDFSDFD